MEGAHRKKARKTTSGIFFSFIFISWRLMTLQYCSGFCHTLTWISHGFTCVPHPDPPSRLLPHPIRLGLPSAPAMSTCLMHPTWAGDLFHPWQYTCYSAILSEYPTLAFSHRVQKSVLYICVFFSVLYIGLSLQSFKIPYICVSRLYWSLSFWLTSLCITSGFWLINKGASRGDSRQNGSSQTEGSETQQEEPWILS